MLQRLPPAAGAADEVEDGWRRALALMASSTEQELLDERLAPNDLLYRLFHEDGVRVFAQSSLRPGCRCSRERVERVLRSLPTDEHVTLAWGRDFGDVSPLKGVILGGGRHSLSVNVDVAAA